MESFSFHHNLDIAAYDDVALLKLINLIEYTDYVLPICLPPYNKLFKRLDFLANKTLTTIGYGKVEQGVCFLTMFSVIVAFNLVNGNASFIHFNDLVFFNFL